MPICVTVNTSTSTKRKTRLAVKKQARRTAVKSGRFFEIIEPILLDSIGAGKWEPWEYSSGH